MKLTKFIKLTDEQRVLLRVYQGLKSFARREELTRKGWTEDKILSVSNELVTLKLFRIDKNRRYSMVLPYKDTTILLKSQDFNEVELLKEIQDRKESIVKYMETKSNTPNGSWLTREYAIHENLAFQIKYCNEHVIELQSIINYRKAV